MFDYEQIIRGNKKYEDYWESQRQLCQIQLDKKRLAQSSLYGSQDRLYPQDVLEDEANKLLNSMSNKDLASMLSEIKLNLSSNSGFTTEMQYWQNLSLKIKAKIAINKIESIYELFLQRNKEKIDLLVQEEEKKE